MKPFNKLPLSYRIDGLDNLPDGIYVIPVSGKKDVVFTVVVGTAMDWEHVSVVIRKRKIARSGEVYFQISNRCPTWEQMCHIKNLFWDPEEVVVQYHPKESEYHNLVETCLHLWKPTKLEIPTPPLEML